MTPSQEEKLRVKINEILQTDIARVEKTEQIIKAVEDIVKKSVESKEESDK